MWVEWFLGTRSTLFEMSRRRNFSMEEWLCVDLYDALVGETFQEILVWKISCWAYYEYCFDGLGR